MKTLVNRAKPKKVSAARVRKLSKRRVKFEGGSVRPHATCPHGQRRSNCMKCGGRTRCIHGRQQCYCVLCRGSQICIHLRRRAVCKECGGSQICPHGRLREVCRECFGSQICPHGRNRGFCKLCGGSQMCMHGVRRSVCKACGGSQICEHGRRRETCRDCGGAQVCPHGRQRYYCRECGGSAICIHNTRKDRCKICLERKTTNGKVAHHKRRFSKLSRVWKERAKNVSLRKRPASSSARPALGLSSGAVRLSQKSDVTMKLEHPCKREPDDDLNKAKQERIFGEVNFAALQGRSDGVGRRAAGKSSREVLGAKRVKIEQHE